MIPYTHKIQGLGASLTDRTAAPAPIAWTYLASSAASSAAVGAGIGYLAAKSTRGATTGALAGAAAWGANSAINEFFLDHKVLSAALAVTGIGALFLAWKR